MDTGHLARKHKIEITDERGRYTDIRDNVTTFNKKRVTLYYMRGIEFSWRFLTTLGCDWHAALTTILHSFCYFFSIQAKLIQKLRS